MNRKSLVPVLVALVLTLAHPVMGERTDKTIDFAGFMDLSAEVREARSSRLLPLDEFLVVAAEPHTVLLDTRSESAFAAKHLAGAVNLSFADLTKQTLESAVGGRDRTVLIYCNNNFSGGQAPFMTKVPPAALNIPTFVSLWAYGYRDVYELGELVEESDPRIAFEGLIALQGHALESTRADRPDRFPR